jgi:predicted ABC-type ATPase
VGEARPVLWLIAGPNGVGKTTYARRYLRAVAGTERFVNLDEIARGFSPLTPTPDAETAAAAARAVLARSAETIAARRSFALETTLAGRTHLRTLDRAKAAGFAATLVFCILPDVETALARIAARVAAGGHAVPEADARRRFPRACANFATYAAACDAWRILDTRLAEPRLVASGPPGTIADPALHAALPAALREGLAALG